MPFLWIITPTISKGILKHFTATPKENWETGIYFLTSGLSKGIQQEINMLIRQLKHKIGNLSPELEAKVKNIPIDNLKVPILGDLGAYLALVLNFTLCEI